jgi:maleate isomerase
MWQPDGWGFRARIGVLTPHGDIGPECELSAMAPDGVSVHAARIPLGVFAVGREADRKSDPLEHYRAFAAPPLPEQAAELLAAAPLHVIAFAFTSSSYVRGPDEDAALKTRLEAVTGGIPVVVTCSSAVLALHTLGVRRLAITNPPWFTEEVDRHGVEYFRARGFEIVASGPAGLPRAQREIHAGAVYEWVRAHTPASAEAVFIGGNGLRAVGAIQALEEDLGRPVLTANQVALWHALSVAGTRVPVTGYGQIFTHAVPHR